MKKFDSYLILKDGTIYRGYNFGVRKNICSEVVIDTTMTDYAESLKKKEYKDKIVNFTYPLIGNCGISKDDYEYSSYDLSAIIVREECTDLSNIRDGYTLDETLKHKNIVGISGIDTRSIANKVREKCSVKACIVGMNSEKNEVENILKSLGMERDILEKTLEIL